MVSSNFYGSLGNYVLRAVAEISFGKAFIEELEWEVLGGFSDREKKERAIPVTELELDANADSRRIDGSQGSYRVGGSLSTLDLNDLPFAVCVLGEYKRQQEMGVVSMHGNALCDASDNAYLVLGNKGTGKTSISVELADNYGFTLLGDDLIGIGIDRDILVYPGNRNVRVRPVVSEKDSGYEKRLVRRFRQGDNMAKKLTQVIRINIHPANGRLVVVDATKSDVEKERIRFRELGGQFIRGLKSYLRVNGRCVFIPSSDTTELFEMREELIERILAEVPFRYIYASSPREAADLIQRL